jgi:hypothetical protein
VLEPPTEEARTDSPIALAALVAAIASVIGRHQEPVRGPQVHSEDPALAAAGRDPAVRAGHPALEAPAVAVVAGDDAGDREFETHH